MSSMIGSRGPTGLPAGKQSTGNIVPKGYQYGQLQQFTPQQMDLFSRLFSQAAPDSFLSKLAGGDQSQFEQLEAPALKQFGNVQANIASRFSGMGSGARRSSGFMNTQNQAAQDFAESLQSQRLGLQRQALQDLMGISSTLLGQRPYEQILTQKPEKMSFWKQLLLGSGEGIGSAATTLGSMPFLKRLGMG